MSLHTPRAVARERSGAYIWGRLHALWYHRIIRAPADHPEFGALVAQGFAMRRHHGRQLPPGKCDYVITGRGLERAYELF